MTIDLYEILGAERSDDAETIRRKYRKLAKVVHPDVGGDAETFRCLTQAMEVLTDPERRKRYDETGIFEDGPADNSDAAALSIISNFIGALVQGVTEVEEAVYADPFEAFRSEAASQVQTAKNAITRHEKNVGKIERLKKRFKHEGKGEDFIAKLLDQRIANARLSIEAGQQHIARWERAVEISKGYRFETDKRPEAPAMTAQMVQQMANMMNQPPPGQFGFFRYTRT